MNLLTDSWIPVRRRAGQREDIAPWQVSDGVDGDNPIVALDAPRADFNGALMQFLIGALQTASAPERRSHWEQRFRQPPSPEALRVELDAISEAFEFGAERPSFMEDLDLEGEADKPISALLIEAPGGNTLKQNKDLFVKRDYVSGLSAPAAAMALLTLQINAPSGGSGHRTSLRGGGPLTTLVVNEPRGAYDRLWHNLWLNVLERRAFESLAGRTSLDEPGSRFPWLSDTRVSGGQEAFVTTPEDAHPLIMYWAMPRRIRLDRSNTRVGVCDLTGRDYPNLIAHYCTKNYGANYEGAWVHPLSPYRDDSSGPIPFHPQPGGIHYRHWLGLTENQPGASFPAAVVDAWHERANDVPELGEQTLHLWSFGYDMDNMKARCWYESVMPLFHVTGDRDRFSGRVEALIGAAEQASGYLRTALKQAWFKRPKDAKGDTSFVTDAFRTRTEAAFYERLRELARAIETLDDAELDEALLRIGESWLRRLRGDALTLFDQWATGGYFEAEDPGRIANARNALVKKLHGGKLKTSLRLAETV